jgi:hypothetical protein
MMQRTAFVLALIAIAVALTSAGLLVRWDNRRDSEVASLQREVGASQSEVAALRRRVGDLQRTVADQRPYVRAVEGICHASRTTEWPDTSDADAADAYAIAVGRAVISGLADSCTWADVPKTTLSKP